MSGDSQRTASSGSVLLAASLGAECLVFLLLAIHRGLDSLSLSHRLAGEGVLSHPVASLIDVALVPLIAAIVCGAAGLAAIRVPRRHPLFPLIAGLAVNILLILVAVFDFLTAGKNGNLAGQVTAVAAGGFVGTAVALRLSGRAKAQRLDPVGSVLHQAK
jgi:hypothetical protein